jgi:hypothetical protein
MTGSSPSAPPAASTWPCKAFCMTASSGPSSTATSFLPDLPSSSGTERTGSASTISWPPRTAATCRWILGWRWSGSSPRPSTTRTAVTCTTAPSHPAPSTLSLTAATRSCGSRTGRSRPTRTEPAPARPARQALSSVHGVDKNPYAAAIASFRLMLAAMREAGVRPGRPAAPADRQQSRRPPPHRRRLRLRRAPPGRPRRRPRRHPVRHPGHRARPLPRPVPLQGRRPGQAHPLGADLGPAARRGQNREDPRHPRPAQVQEHRLPQALLLAAPRQARRPQGALHLLPRRRPRRRRLPPARLGRLGPPRAGLRPHQPHHPALHHRRLGHRPPHSADCGPGRGHALGPPVAQRGGPILRPVPRRRLRRIPRRPAPHPPSHRSGPSLGEAPGSYPAQDCRSSRKGSCAEVHGFRSRGAIRSVRRVCQWRYASRR